MPRKKVYLGYAMTGIPETEWKTEGNELEKILEEAGFKVLNPGKLYPWAVTPAFIVKKDLDAIQRADIVVSSIAKGMREGVVLAGVFQELVYAKAMQKEVFVFLEDPFGNKFPKEKVSVWVHHHARVFDTLDDVITCLQQKV